MHTELKINRSSNKGRGKSTGSNFTSMLILALVGHI